MQRWHFLLAALLILGVVGWYIAARHEGYFNGTGLRRGQLVRVDEQSVPVKIYTTGRVTHRIIEMSDDFVRLEDVVHDRELAISPLAVEVVR